MICGNCSIENKRTSRFCGQCGNKLNYTPVYIDTIKNNFQQVKPLAIGFLESITLHIKSAPINIKKPKYRYKLIKYVSFAVLISMIAYEGHGIYYHSRISFVESLLGYQYDLKSGEKLILTKRDGQYYYSAEKDASK